ncbi:unnamed protein product [Schistosoma mattheei]|uniref:Uncharacterized protein n=1 Tax=Schistosoma mattheei TaxID=31246 RepID=A0A3P8GXM7_9TREM|nr:unnamed protein product [Schistosoma mattheei]
MTRWSGLPIVMTQLSHIGWNRCSCRFYHARQVDWRTVRLKAATQGLREKLYC